MADALGQEAGDRLVIYLDPGGPVELTGLTESFAALARMYERHYPHVEGVGGAPKLYVVKLTTGSIKAIIAPYAQLLTEAYPYVAAFNTVGDFAKRISDGVKAFCELPTGTTISPSVEDARDLREFIKPLTGKNGAQLRVAHARFAKRNRNGEVVAEYDFSEAQLNRASVNINRALEEPEAEVPSASKLVREVLLIVDRASRAPGKDRGRATDWAKVPEVSPKALPTYFRQSAAQGDLKQQLVRGEVNPLTDRAFIVDVSVTYINGEPKTYIVANVHTDVPLPDED